MRTWMREEEGSGRFGRFSQSLFAQVTRATSLDAIEVIIYPSCAMGTHEPRADAAQKG
jgi:hypothetical protein